MFGKRMILGEIYKLEKLRHIDPAAGFMPVNIDYTVPTKERPRIHKVNAHVRAVLLTIHM